MLLYSKNLKLYIQGFTHFCGVVAERQAESNNEEFESNTCYCEEKPKIYLKLIEALWEETPEDQQLTVIQKCNIKGVLQDTIIINLLFNLYKQVLASIYCGEVEACICGVIIHRLFYIENNLTKQQSLIGRCCIRNWGNHLYKDKKIEKYVLDCSLKPFNPIECETYCAFCNKKTTNKNCVNCKKRDIVVEYCFIPLMNKLRSIRKAINHYKKKLIRLYFNVLSKNSGTYEKYKNRLEIEKEERQKEIEKRKKEIREKIERERIEAMKRKCLSCEIELKPHVPSYCKYCYSCNIKNKPNNCEKCQTPIKNKFTFCFTCK